MSSLKLLKLSEERWKGPLRRDVVRVVTPGTLQEDDLLQAHQHNFLAAIGRSQLN